MPMARTWEGLTLQSRIHRAAGRAITAIGTHIVVETKRVTHVQYGHLRHSVHVAPPGYAEQEIAGIQTTITSEIGNMAEHISDGTTHGPAIEVGSWLPYACAEWVGRGHPGITEGLEAVRGIRATSIVAQAFAEEGLK